MLRGEPLVPLSDVTFAEAAGRVRAVAMPIDPEAGSANGAGNDNAKTPSSDAQAAFRLRADPRFAHA